MDTVVLYPTPGIGHLVSMVELGKLILKTQPSFSIIIFMAYVPYNTGSTAPYISRVSATTPSITFHHLPAVSLPPNSSTLMEDLAFEIPRLNNSNVHGALQAVSQKSNLRAFIIDFFCNASFEVSTSLNIPTFYFYTSGASALCIFLYLTTIHETITKNIKEVNAYINVPGTPPIYSLDLPDVLFYRNTTAYKNLLNTSNNMSKSSGIITNTFELLEPRAVKAISDGLCVPNGSTPPVHHIGPLIATNDDQSHDSEHECLNWLKAQPSRSVVFLCFGSMGTFKGEQLKEMAIALERSGHRFLWVVRNPPEEDEAQHMRAAQDPDLDSFLPEGFLGRTKERGFVVKSWAPQVAVLNHDSVGGFVTHCGWNSALEAICAGVPMVAWPLYAEQRLNRLFLVEEIRVALKLEESEGGFVTATELEKRVRELMDSLSGKAVRDRVMAMRDGAKAAMEVGGSSHVALTKLLNSWKQ